MDSFIAIQKETALSMQMIEGHGEIRYRPEMGLFLAVEFWKMGKIGNAPEPGVLSRPPHPSEK